MAPTWSKTNIYSEIPPLFTPCFHRELVAKISGITEKDLSSLEEEDAGCYVFQTEQAAVSSNFIHWRSHGPVLHLVQDSLQGVVTHNSVKISFSNRILPGGVEFFETNLNIVLLVATNASVHRMVLQKSAAGENVSVLDSLTSHQLNDPSNIHVYRTQAAASCPKVASAYLSPSEETYFAVAVESSIQLIKLGKAGQVTVANELRHDSYMGRILGGLVPGVLRSNKPNASLMEAVQIVPLKNDIFVFGLTRDAKLHAWNAISLEHKGCKAVGKEFHSGADQHRMKAWTDENDLTHLIIFLASDKWQQFVVHEVYFTGILNFDVSASIQLDQAKLLGFSCGINELFALCDVDGVVTLRHTSLISPDNVWVTDNIWKFFETPELPSHDQLETKEVHLRDIFWPNRYRDQTIQQALTEFCQRHSLDLAEGTLRELLVEAADFRIAQLFETDIEEDPSEAVWKELRTLCLDNQKNYLMPVSVSADPSSGIILVLRREATGLVRRMDDLELSFYPGNSSLKHVTGIDKYDSPVVAQTVHGIAQLLESVRELLENRQETFFQECLEAKSEPSHIAADIAKKLYNEHGAISVNISRFLSSVGPVTAGFEMIGQLLVPSFEPASCSPHKHLSQSFPHELAQKCAAQMVHYRYALCRDLLIVIELLNAKRKFIGLQSRDENSVSASMRIAFSQYTLSYWLTSWICNTPVSPVPPTTKMTLGRKLTLLSKVAEVYSYEGIEHGRSLADLYVQSYGFKIAAVDCRKSHTLDDTIDMLLTTIGHSVLSQLNSHPKKLIVTLLSSCQYVGIQTYLHFLGGLRSAESQTDITYNGLACYLSGEPDKACNIFIRGLQSEARQEQMDSDEEDMSRNSHRLDYLMSVISLFDGDNLNDSLAELIVLALKSCEPNSSLASTLWCKLFWARLALGQNSRAYLALESNPDVSQTSDLLRAFLFTLLERGHARDLLSYSYSGMEDCIYDYLLSRARSIVVEEAKDYYSFLYSLNITKSNPRRASIATYEQAYRLKTESEPSISTLQQRVQCLLATIACLELVDPPNAWVEEPGLKRGIDDEMKGEAGENAMTCDVYELSDVRKEYDLAVAQLNLLLTMEKQGMYSLAPSSAEETVGQLVKMRSYELAISTSKRFGLSGAPIVDALTSDYVHLLKSLKGDYSAESETLQMIRSNNPTVREDPYGRPLEQVQRLLEMCLTSAENPLETSCHRASAYRMLSGDICLPAWLVKSYTTRNQAELISLYHQLGFLEEASRLAIERYSELARRMEHVAFKRTEEDMPASRLIVLDRLVMELKHQATLDSYWTKVLDEVKSIRSAYLESVRKADAAVYG